MSRGWTDKKYNKPKDFNIRFIYDHRVNAAKDNEPHRPRGKHHKYGFNTYQNGTQK